MVNQLKILYVDLGGVTVYCCDKPAGRILGWANAKNQVYILAPNLIKETMEKEIDALAEFPDSIHHRTLPCTTKSRSSSLGIIFSYGQRLILSPFVLWSKMPKLDFGFSNSPVLIDILPILILKLFGRCRHWILMMDSIVPEPQKRTGSSFINYITYLESLLVVKLASWLATAVFTVNPELKTALISRGLSQNKIILSKNGLFFQKLDLVPEPQTKTYDAVFMGRITENKGIFDLLTVWQKIIEKLPQAKLAIIGTGREDVVNRLISFIKENKLEKNIDYLGFVHSPQKYKLLKSAKIFLFLSKVNADESWGISLMEALACGLPAITYDLEIYKHVYSPNILIKKSISDLTAVYQETINLLNDSARRLILADTVKRFARQFDWLTIAEQDLNQIKKILSL